MMDARETRWSWGARCALAALPLLLGGGCSDECVDKFDCRSKAKQGEELTCNNGKCVVLPPSGADAGGGAPDAGTTDAGGADAGPSDGGATDGGLTDAGHQDGGTDGGGTTLWTVKMTGSQEVPPVSTASSGSGTVTVSEQDGGASAVLAIVHTVLSPTAAHIHSAPAGFPGPVMIPLDAGTPIAQTVTLTALQLAQLRAGRLYINVHTAANPNGEIRGQIVKPGVIVFTAHLAASGGIVSDGGAVGFLADADAGVVTYEGAVAADVEASGAAIRDMNGVIQTLSVDAGMLLGSFPYAVLAAYDGGYTVSISSPDSGTAGLVSGPLVEH